MPDLHGPLVITGASGFVGRALVPQVSAPCTSLSFGAPDWERRLADVELGGATIFHLAARVHGRSDDEGAFQADNVHKTHRLAQAAASAGARRLVFLSTIKVHGEESRGRPFQAGDPPAPEDAYARSKADAEQALHEVASQSKLELVVVRAPLVYGPCARANLAALLRLADSPWPLPFASLTAQRSFIQVDDLARLLIACGELPAASGKTYIAAHPTGVSAARVVSLMRVSLGRPERLFRMPASALEATGALVGQAASARRLTRPLLGDPSAANRELQWSAQVPIEHAVEEMVREYRARGRH